MAGKILVVGANGSVGSKVVRALAAKGERVKAASRKGLPAAGAEAVAFDYRECSTYGRALDGADRIFVIAPAGCLDPVQLLTPIIQAAAARGIKIVLMTLLGLEADDDFPYRQVELFVEKTGAKFVLIRPNCFADNFHTYWLEGVRRGAITVPAADAKVSFIDARDVAESVTAALTSDVFNGQAFNTTGPEALSYAEAAAILSRVTGKPITYKSVDDETFIAMLSEGGVPKAYARYLATLFRPVREGRMAAPTDDVQRLTGKPPRPFETYARDNVAALMA
ncbi:SDR family oxidoreductase [Sinorhizobium numidicum]|uniref:SDR family oxidoreductase n=1 Tax=Sinorhizobium numidicum TaxID=680248 RepID=A0ABY8D287_9HYPH|nr:SDR family oxidoreductase [Sinorhizobium numidicum]WEX78340.1 SDR family oxidoreductase [Sinorhizobium numidicum]WEX84999.1 SDR family oxidoreductase [Sinorhizobium numidicum]